MGSSTLHILNGDSTKNIFPTTQIEGDLMVWRETLIQGPLFYAIDNELFWEMRAQFMEKAYKVKLFEYKRKVIQEFHKISKFSGSEIVLWFEYDVFCQVNMISILSYLLRMKKSCVISLVCVGDYPGYDKKVGLGEIPQEDYINLFKNRQTLEKSDLLVADRAWMYFCGKEVSKFEKIKSSKLNYLSEALYHSKSLINQDDQISALERKVLEAISKNKFSKMQLVGYLLKNDGTLGFGDLQFINVIENLSSYTTENENIISLNEKGRQMIR